MLVEVPVMLSRVALANRTRTAARRTDTNSLTRL
jgi:hypothetical protein